MVSVRLRSQWKCNAIVVVDCHSALWLAKVSKGQLISKAIYGLLTSPKKQTEEFVLFAFLLKQIKFVCSFFRRIYGLPICFRFYLTFRMHQRENQMVVTLIYGLILPMAGRNRVNEKWEFVMLSTVQGVPNFQKVDGTPS